ncbi:hypothetical protein IEQ34_006254 [Dendrobium chrysotoxum]|uniref:Uncharacterized protein n=1 Tax=Dendrobium chrysotoxum TaxID=161865 RepID=A0AAV7HB52_DENCH|nr:hypothetical protein IEQ34_006254 [Dendrobium chrysotoxum]
MTPLRNINSIQNSSTARITRPPFLCFLHLESLGSLDCPPSCLSSLSSFHELHINFVPWIRTLPTLPLLRELNIGHLANLHCLPSNLPESISFQRLENCQTSFPLCFLHLESLGSLDCPPFCVYSLSSFHEFHINSVPRILTLPTLPPLRELNLGHLANLHCLPSNLPSLFSLKKTKNQYGSKDPRIVKPPSLFVFSLSRKS